MSKGSRSFQKEVVLLNKKGSEGKIFGEKFFKKNLFKTKFGFLKKGISSFFEVNSKGGYYGWGLLPQYKPPFVGVV